MQPRAAEPGALPPQFLTFTRGRFAAFHASLPPPHCISVLLPLNAILLYFVSRRQVTKQHTSKMTPLYIPLVHANKQFIIHL